MNRVKNIVKIEIMERDFAACSYFLGVSQLYRMFTFFGETLTGLYTKYGTQRNMKQIKFTRYLTFVLLAIVMFSKSLVFRDVGIKELQRILWDNTICNDLIVPYYISNGQGVETVFRVRLYRDELWVSCGQISCV